MNRFERRHPDAMDDWPEEYRSQDFVSTWPSRHQPLICGVTGCRYVEAIVW